MRREMNPMTPTICIPTRSARRPAWTGLVAALLLILPAQALAQPTPSMDVQRFDPVAGYHSFVLVETGRQLPALRPGFDLWLSYAHHPLQYSSADLERREGIIDGLFTGHLRAGFGITDWAEVDVKIPFLQLSRIGTAFTGYAPGSTQYSLGDIAIEGRFRLLAEEKAVGIALIPFVKLPTGKRGLYQTSGVPTFGAKAAVSKHWRVFHVAGHVGYELKPGAAEVENVGADDEILYGVGVGVSPVPEWLDVNLELSGSGLVGPGRGRVGDSANKSGVHSPLELLLNARLRTPVGLDVVLGGGPGITPGAGTPEWRLFAGVGWAPPLGPGDRDKDGVADDNDGCPDEPEDRDRFEDADGCPDPDNDSDGLADGDDQCPNDAEDADGFEDGDGCPDTDNDDDGIADASDRCPDEAEDTDEFQDDDGCPDTDNDGDGILDAEDGCPVDPEDIDGFEDDDGCPDTDNDGDGIADVDDLCPDQPEQFNGERDDDGCPDEIKAVVTKDKIVILDKVLFVTAKDVIIRSSYPVLDAVTQTLLENPQITRVSVEGHTDSRGSDSSNQALSEKRAAAVVRYLVKAGIDEGRLQSAGFGETRAIADNETSDGQQKNRRVEFVIVEQE